MDGFVNFSFFFFFFFFFGELLFVKMEIPFLCGVPLGGVPLWVVLRCLRVPLGDFESEKER